MKQRLLHLVLVLLAALAVQAQELVVCSYNVRNKNTNDTNEGNGWDTRRTYINNFINFQQPDLLGVQEAKSGQMNDMANGLIGYKYIGVGRNDGGTSGEYAGIFYRTERMELLDHGDFWLSDTPYTPSKGFPSKGGSTQYYRICTWGKFYDKAASKVVYYFNTHYDLDETNRQQSFYVIRDKIKEIASTTDPVIISGDFNAQPTANSYKYFINSKFLYDCYDQAKQKFAPNATNSGFDGNNYLTSSGSITRIDHIFVTKVFNITHYGILNPCYYSTSGTSHSKEYPSVPLEQLLQESDIVSIHAPLNDKTAGLIGKKELQLMKSSAYLINMGRGGIVVEQDLAEAVDAGIIAGAGLDVFAKEPLPKDNCFLTMQHPERLSLAPHVAWASTEARNRLIQMIAENIKTTLN